MFGEMKLRAVSLFKIAHNVYSIAAVAELELQRLKYKIK